MDKSWTDTDKIYWDGKHNIDFALLATVYCPQQSKFQITHLLKLDFKLG